MSRSSSMSSIEESPSPGERLEPIQSYRSKSHQKGQADGNDLHMIQSHVSNHDMPVAPEEFREVDAEQYLRFSPARKRIIVATLSLCSFLAPVGSTSILSGIPEVAKTYNSTGSIINGSNALYLGFMGLASPFWGPLSQVWGRRPVSDHSFMLIKTKSSVELDLSCELVPVYVLQYRHSSCSKPRLVFHLPSTFRVPRHIFLGSRQLRHWRYL